MQDVDLSAIWVMIVGWVCTVVGSSAWTAFMAILSAAVLVVKLLNGIKRYRNKDD